VLGLKKNKDRLESYFLIKYFIRLLLSIAANIAVICSLQTVRSRILLLNKIIRDFFFNLGADLLLLLDPESDGPYKLSPKNFNRFLEQNSAR
jgi:hypothetical protein